MSFTCRIRRVELIEVKGWEMNKRKQDQQGTGTNGKADQWLPRHLNRTKSGM